MAASSLEAGALFYCKVCCHTYLVNCLNGLKETYTQHKATTHSICMKCTRSFTSNRQEEHNNSYREYYNRRFTHLKNLKRHKTDYHGSNVHCILCGLNDEFEPIRLFSSKNELISHVREEHPDRQIYCCPNRTFKDSFKSNSELEKHILLHHKFHCVYCPATRKDTVTGRGIEFPSHRSLNRLRQHIAVQHNDNPYFYCGQLFRNQDELYLHQKYHCLTTYTCSACNKKFANITALNCHLAEHVSALGACSTSSHTWHAMKHKYKPWNRDAEKMVDSGFLQNKIEKEHQKRERRKDNFG